MKNNEKYIGVIVTSTIFVISLLIGSLCTHDIIINSFDWRVNFLVVILLLIFIYYTSNKQRNHKILNFGLFAIIAFIFQNTFMAYLVNIMSSSDNDTENDFIYFSLSIPLTFISILCFGIYYDNLRLSRPFKGYIMIIVIIITVWFSISLYLENTDKEKIIGDKVISGLNNTKIEFHQGQKFMGVSDIRYYLKNQSDTLIKNQFLFHTSDDLEIEDLYTKSYDSIIYVSFSNSKDDILYFVDLKTNLNENTNLTVNKDSMTVDRYQFLQDSLYHVKDSIFKVLHKYDNNLKMTGYNK